MFPNDSGVINVKSFGAVGDGETDDTIAIQSALNEARGYMTGNTVYFPNGVYKVSNTLVMTEYEAPGTSAQRTISLQGQSRDGVIIQLADGAFGSARKAVLTTFQPIAPSAVPTPSPTSRNFTNSAFATNIQNLTVDVGVGNPNAVGIVYIANNQGSLRDILIRSSDPERAGLYGLDALLSRITGPALVKNVTIDGFDYGLNYDEAQYATVFENLTVRNQRIAGVLNRAHVLSIRRLLSENSVPAIRQVVGTFRSGIGTSQGLIVLVDSVLAGGAEDNPAIDLQDGFLFARHVTTDGYAAAINDHGTLVSGPNIAEYKTGDTASLFESPSTSLNLEVKETPEVPFDNPALICTPETTPCALGTWADVTRFGATRGDSTDDTAAIQAAINSGATTVLFPNRATSETGSQYVVTQTVTVGGNVRRLMGMSCNIRVNSPLTSGGAVFKFVDGNQPMVLLENFRMSNSIGSQWFIEQASAKTLVLRNLLIRRGYAYRNTSYGDVFIEDFHSLPLSTPSPAPQFIFTNQRVWARQIDPEQTSDRLGSPLIVNNGATVWMLGLKSEQAATLVETVNGGRTEVLGGITLNSSTVPAPTTTPAFINTDSHVSIVHTEYRQNMSRGFFQTVVQETRRGATRQLANTDLPSRKAALDDSGAYVIPLYTGYEPLTSTLVSGQVKAESSGLFYIRKTGAYWGTIKITNISDQTIEGPLQVVLLNLSQNIELKNAAGTYGGSNPYLTVPVRGLAPGQSVRVKVRFSNPGQGIIDYITQVYSGIF